MAQKDRYLTEFGSTQTVELFDSDRGPIASLTYMCYNCEKQHTRTFSIEDYYSGKLFDEIDKGCVKEFKHLRKWLNSQLNYKI